MIKRSCAAVILLLSVFLFVVPVQTPEAAEPGPFYAGVFGGYTFGSDASWNYFPFTAFDADVQETWTVGAKFGYIPPAARFMAVELEYFYLNPDIDRSGSNLVTVEGDATAHNFMVNFLVRYPEGRFHPYLGVGLGFSSVNVSGTSTTRVGGITSTGPLDASDTAFAYQILAGINYEINTNWSADLTYRWFSTDPDINGGDIDYTTNLITIGVNYHF
jgi:opacity protein-like surface antigen